MSDGPSPPLLSAAVWPPASSGLRCFTKHLAAWQRLPVLPHTSDPLPRGWILISRVESRSAARARRRPAPELLLWQPFFPALPEGASFQPSQSATRDMPGVRGSPTAPPHPASGAPTRAAPADTAADTAARTGKSPRPPGQPDASNPVADAAKDTSGFPRTTGERIASHPGNTRTPGPKAPLALRAAAPFDSPSTVTGPGGALRDEPQLSLAGPRSTAPQPPSPARERPPHTEQPPTASRTAQPRIGLQPPLPAAQTRRLSLHTPRHAPTAQPSTGTPPPAPTSPPTPTLPLTPTTPTMALRSGVPYATTAAPAAVPSASATAQARADSTQAVPLTLHHPPPAQPPTEERASRPALTTRAPALPPPAATAHLRAVPTSMSAASGETVAFAADASVDRHRRVAVNSAALAREISRSHADLLARALLPRLKAAGSRSAERERLPTGRDQPR